MGEERIRRSAHGSRRYVQSMAAVVSLIVVVTLGLILTRVATVALTMTGMTLEHARFQARSAFTGTGFTTSEAEAVVNHPARRRIVMVLMLVSGAGAVSVVGTLVLSFAGVDSTGGGLERAAVIVVALTGLLWLAKSRVVDRYLRRVIERLLRRFTDLSTSGTTPPCSTSAGGGGWCRCRCTRATGSPRAR